MKGFLRYLITLLFAISITSPVCCCQMAPEAPGDATSCCGGQMGDDKPDHDCACTGRLLTAAWDQEKILPAPEAEFAKIVWDETTDLRPARVEWCNVPNQFPPDSGPLARRLARLQRYLI